MNETMRGTRLGSTSYELGHVPSAPTRLTTFTCLADHVTRMPFAAEADEIPDTWECAECGNLALREGATAPMAPEPLRRRSHFDMLLERRSRADLLMVLDERLGVLNEVKRTA